MRYTSPLRTLRGNRGATSTEMMVLLILVGVLAIGMVKAFGGVVKGKFTDAQGHVSKNVNADGTPPPPGSEDGSGGAGGAGGAGAVDADGNPIQGGKNGKHAHVKRYSADAKLYRDSALQKKKKRSKYGINPITLIIIFFFVGLLVYVVYKGNDQSQ